MRKAWEKHPPVDWLAAAYLGYKSQDEKHHLAVENTKRMFGVLQVLGNVNMIAGHKM